MSETDIINGLSSLARELRELACNEQEKRYCYERGECSHELAERHHGASEAFWASAEDIEEFICALSREDLSRWGVRT